eukprot:10766112-Alexandrium_andersonii.AAC.1
MKEHRIAPCRSSTLMARRRGHEVRRTTMTLARCTACPCCQQCWPTGATGSAASATRHES